MRILIMTGARPNFIKVAPLIWAIEKARLEGRDVDFTLVYAGSNDDKQLEDSLFDALLIKRPDIFLGIDSSDTIEITSRVMTAMEDVLTKQPCDVMIVVDDLASTMAAAIVAKKKGLRLAHLAAGTRSFDINMPKEINRLVIDGLSDYLFTAGVSTGTTANPSKIFCVGNILIDTLRRNYSRFQRPAVLAERHIDDGKYIVLTINRRALLQNEHNLRAMLQAVADNAGGTPILAPLRGAAQEIVGRMNIPGVDIIQPLGYLDFGYLTGHAMAIVTDSGNIAEEATFNSIPCVTLNNYTEHIETVKQGTNILVNEDPQLLAKTIDAISRGQTKSSTIPEKWDGRTAERVLQIIGV